MNLKIKSIVVIIFLLIASVNTQINTELAKDKGKIADYTSD